MNESKALSDSRTHADALKCLTERERLVAVKFAEGYSYREVAAALDIAPATVRNHLTAVYRKLGIGNKAQLVRLIDGGAARAQQPGWDTLLVLMCRLMAATAHNGRLIV